MGLDAYPWTGKLLVSVYMPCASNGTSLVYAQQQRYLDGKQDKHDPQAAISEDLASVMRKLRDEGDCIVIGMDAEEEVQNPDLEQFFKTFLSISAIMSL